MLAFAQGKPWLGFETPKEGVSCLYLQIELSHQMLQERVKQMTSKSVPMLVEPHVWTEHYIKLDIPAGIEVLDEGIQQVQPQVLIIDPVYKILSGNILEAHSVERLLDNLDILIAKYGISVILVSHSRKGAYEEWGSDDMLGSVFFSAWADTIIRLERGGDSSMTAKFEVVRHAKRELPSRTFALDRDNLDFVTETRNSLDALDGKPQI